MLTGNLLVGTIVSALWRKTGVGAGMDAELINRQEYETARTQLGANFGRILGYFREDGIKSVEQIELAMRNRDATGLVRPAHTLKGESRQFGSIALGNIAEKIEMTARRCVEQRISPEELIAEVAELRACFTRTLAELERGNVTAAAPHRPVTGFGRKVTSTPLSGFGRG